MDRHPDESQGPDHKARSRQSGCRCALRSGFRLSPEWRWWTWTILPIPPDVFRGLALSTTSH